MAMHKDELVTVDIGAIDPNPHRQLGRYKFNERKIAALQQSYDDVGHWPSIIVRRRGNRFEQAFGHHRMEAARRAGMTQVPVIVREIADIEMLKLMSRENMSDFDTTLLGQLEVWEAACKWVDGSKPIEVAHLLGWVEPGHRVKWALDSTARACNAASAMIEDGWLDPADLDGLATWAALEVVERARSRMNQIDRMAKKTGRPVAEVTRAKGVIADAAKATAQQVRDGAIGTRAVRGNIDVTAFKLAREAKRASPLFESFATQTANSLARALTAEGTAGKRLAEIGAVLPDLDSHTDQLVVQRIDYELGQLAERARAWQRRLRGGELMPVEQLQITGGAHDD